MEKKSCDVLIIGGGPAGLMAGVYAARAGMNTVIVERLGVGGQIMLTPDIENFPGFLKVGGAELAEKMSEQATHCGVETIYDEIEEIDLVGKTVKCTDVEINAKAIIIAAGAHPRPLGAENETRLTGSGVHYCALCDGAFYKGKNVVVVGGGNSAVEEAIYMAAIATHVTVINNLSTWTAQAVLIEKLESLENITVHHNSTVSKIVGEKKVEAIETSAGRIECNGVFVAIGRVPSTEMFKEKIELTKQGYIIADKKMQTSVEGVFAAGDVTDKNVRQVITACADGAVAATHAVEYCRLKK